MPVPTGLDSLRPKSRCSSGPRSGPRSLRSQPPRTGSPPRSGALSRFARAIAALAAALLLASCTSGKQEGPAPSGATGQPATSSPAKAAPLRLQLKAGAQGPERGFNAGVAAQRATPDLERFLNRYLSVAFLDPGQQRSGWRELLVLFDTGVQKAARRDLDSLSLGAAAAQVKTVRPGPARASAMFLYQDGRPVGATVKLSFDGSADVEQGTGPIRLRSVFQLLRTAQGWRIVSYQSQTGASP